MHQTFPPIAPLREQPFAEAPTPSDSQMRCVGGGSVGGKGTGLRLLEQILRTYSDLHTLEGTTVRLPRTIVVGTDYFDEWMQSAGLRTAALDEALADEEKLATFLATPLSDALREDLRRCLAAIPMPIAVRSSSLLEDTELEPFAGVFSTYMIPPMANQERRLALLEDAVRGVYASVYYADSLAYMRATGHDAGSEKMALIIQEVAGTAFAGRYYPHISGVARSMNYYPIGDEAATDGIAHLALGLGKYIVDGGRSLRVCPAYPHKVMQTSELDTALRETQTHFLALDTTDQDLTLVRNDAFNLRKLHVHEALADGALFALASTYDPYDMVLRDGIYDGGRKVITFSGVLQHDVFPLPALLQRFLRYGREAMGGEVEMEFAVRLEGNRQGTFFPLQLRPMVAAADNADTLAEEIAAVPADRQLLRSHLAIGHGRVDNVQDIIYVRREAFQAMHNPQMADEIERLNRQLTQEGKPYVLVGPGRWGSSDPWLGIPVKWPHISGARLIVEAGLDHYRVDPSQGSHFFQNLTSMGVGYFTINEYANDGHFRQEWLDALPALHESAHIRHVRCPQPLTILMDGVHRKGVVIC